MFIITLCIAIPTGNESGPQENTVPEERKMMEHQDLAQVFTCTEQPSQPGLDPLWISRLVVATAWDRALILSTGTRI